MSQTVSVTVDGVPITVPSNATIIQACAAAGVDIPRFCYHERLQIAGNCRMCLVQVNGGAKLVASCAMPISNNMRIETGSDAVKKGREGVMEFLLANHPLDCPICDQGGECDLQDQAMAFGSDRSRFFSKENTIEKRAVSDKEFGGGPLIKTSMNRCIHCTRCVRFANDLAGVDALGTTGRGGDMQIGTYVEEAAVASLTNSSNLLGNIIDLCPVGALTSKPYAFMARPWELRRTESIDVMDAVGSAVRIDSRGMQVLRILPRLNESVNEEWLADKSRFACDGLRTQRLMKPMLRTPGTDRFEPVEWERALRIAADRIVQTPADRIEAIAGHFADVETLTAYKDLLGRIGAGRFYFDGPTRKQGNLADYSASYRCNTTIEGLEHADCILLIGTDPKHEAPLLNLRIRKNYMARKFDSKCDAAHIALIGQPPSTSLTYPYEFLGDSIVALRSLVYDAHPFLRRLQNAQRPAILVGEGALADPSCGPETQSLVASLATLLRERLVRDDWNGLNFVPLGASRVGALDIGWSGGVRTGPASELLILINADNVTAADLPKDAFVIYQGHHGDNGANLADLLLPGAAYTEKEATFVNLEGRAQRTQTAVPPPGDARIDWMIVRALAEMARVDLPYETVEQLRERMAEIAPSLATECLDRVHPSRLAAMAAEELRIGTETLPLASDNKPYKSPIADYYLTDCISRASLTMAKCSLALSTVPSPAYK